MTLLSATASAQTAPPPAQTAPDKPSGQSFESYLKASSQHDSSESDTQPLTSRKPSAKEPADKDREKVSKTDSKKTDTSVAPVNLAPVPQVHDPRAFLLSLPTGQPIINLSGNNPSANAAEDRKNTQDAAGGATLQQPAFDPLAQAGTANPPAAAPPKAPIAFSITLPKAGPTQHAPAAAAASASPKNTAEPIVLSQGNKSSSGKQHSESSDSKQSAPVIKGSAMVEPAPKAQAEIPAPSTIPVSAVAASTPHYQTPYSAAPLGNPVAPVAASQVANPAELPQAPTLRPHNIDLQIPGADNSQVDVRVSQRAGDVQVTVRTPDGELAQSLRQHLPELSDRLAQSGVHGEVWQPSAVKTSADTGSNNSESRHRDDSQAQQQHQGRNSDDQPNDRRQGQNAHANAAAWLNEAKLQQVSSSPVNTTEKRSI